MCLILSSSDFIGFQPHIICADVDSIHIGMHIANVLGLECITPTLRRFADGELSVSFDSCMLSGKNVVHVHSLFPNPSDSIINLGMTCDAIMRSGANEIAAVLPYCSYMRQDRCSSRESLGAKVIAKLISDWVDCMVTVDIHVSQLVGFFDIPVFNIGFAPKMIDIAHRCISELHQLDNDSHITIVAPDHGALSRLRSCSDAISLPTAVICKSRSQGKVHADGIVGDIRGSHCILVDDMIDSGESICSAAEFCLENGAKSVSACATHGILSGKALSVLQSSVLDRIFISDTISGVQNITKDYNKLQILTICDILSHCFVPD